MLYERLKSLCVSLIGPVVGIFLVASFIAAIAWCSSEISDEEYEALGRYIEAHPHLDASLEQALGDDGIVSQTEYRFIKKCVETIEKRKVSESKIQNGTRKLGTQSANE